MAEINDLKLEIQSLKEIIEIGKQVTSDMDMKGITKIINYVIRSKFQAQFCAFIIPADVDEDAPLMYTYKGAALEKVYPNFSSIEPLLDFFRLLECNQMSYNQFSNDFNDQYITMLIGTMGTEFLIPLKSDKGVNGLFLQGRRITGETYSTEEISFIVTLLGFVAIALENSNLYRRATIDRMTKLYNHHQFQKTLFDFITEAEITHQVFSLVMLDIDKFKTFNDTFGHLQGDIIIKELSSIIRKTIRDTDYPARYGGEEFTIILPETNLKDARTFAENLRKRVEDYVFSGDERTHKVTISLGVAQYNSQVKNNVDMITLADKALYKSKENGRNQVTLADQLEAQNL